MRYNRLGQTDIRVSSICLGTMTWGEQNSQQDAFDQMDYAIGRGVNFIDTAELYPVPRSSKSFGRTEEYIGDWLTQRGGRDRIILGTKVVGRSDDSWFRPNASVTRLNRQQIVHALDQSLRRLKTDYIDLYQLHWPDRPMNLFTDSRGYSHSDEKDVIPLAETLGVLDDLITQGKIRHIGLSNETPWGVMTCLHHAQQDHLPRVQSVQNAYNLLNRLFEQGLAEVSLREELSLLAYSPLGGGCLSGKYLHGKLPLGSRQQLFPSFADRYVKPGVDEAISKYLALAENTGLTPVQLALKFIDSRPFVTSSIIGATTMNQLRENLAAFETEWTEDMERGVNAIHVENPDPAP